jgi:hypothetical protein
MAATSTDGFLSGHHLEQAIRALQNVRGVREQRTSLHAKLRDAQVNVIEEMGEISHSTDITGLINHYLAEVNGKNILDILMTLAMFAAPVSREKVLDRARQTARDHPLSSLFSSRSVDFRGRTVSVDAGSSELGDDGLTRTILQAQDIHMSLTVAGALDPVREFLMENGPIRFEVIMAMCVNSPFVPLESQHIFAKGLYAFLTGDDAIGIAVLAPLLEGGLRKLLEHSGEIVTSIDVYGIEQTLNLSAILGQKRDIVERILGSGFTFAIEMLFDHQSGPKVRHRICHAIYTDGDFHSKDSAYGCMLIFSLVMLSMRGFWPGLKAHLESVLPLEWLKPIYVEPQDDAGDIVDRGPSL